MRLLNWLGRQSSARMLLLAAIWPLLLFGYAAVQLVPMVLEARNGVMAVSLDVPSWTGLVAVLLGPSLLVMAAWILARRYRPPAR